MTIALHPEQTHHHPGKRFAVLGAAAALAISAGAYLAVHDSSSPVHLPKVPTIDQHHEPESPLVSRTDMTKPR